MMMQNPQQRLSTGEAAALLGVSRDTVRRWAKAGTVPYFQFPSGRIFFRRSDIEALVTPVVIGAKGEVEESGRPFEDVPLPGLLAAV
ncbi:MAG: helix-turn-helix domain-containing protein [Schaalia hyovaginalis]|uniref:helix-turn-helix domain-containing protein n=1 Tax=Schaalia hyovaginalis TaxID=29316 RepID=UPI002A9110C4|nr:helix-turn-helix domain-containing protein [Schaalia hyovaginalis]MDY6213663.1 helix-turn-helix domain-containing protein [Schaalia hyovaginalis]